MGEVMKVSYKIGEIEFEAVGDAAFINEQSRYFVEFLRGEYGKQCKPALGQNEECDCGQPVNSSVSCDNETVIPDNETESHNNETENHNNGTEEPDNGTEITDNGTPAAVVESVKNVEPPEKKKRKRLDMGKIMALKKAGWSNKAIAEEMGMTSGAVAVAISTYKKRGQKNECME